MIRHLAIAALALATGTAGAQSKTIRLTSKILSEERTLHVSLPPDYNVAKEKYDVIYLLDGHNRQFFDLAVAAAGYDFIGDIHDYAMPRQIVVGVEQKNRGDDLGKNQDAFTRYLVQEVVPLIDREYRTNGYRTLIGHSLGGRFALWSICRAPNAFASIVAMSPSVGDSAAFGALTECLQRDWAANKVRLRQLAFGAGERESRLGDGVHRLRDYLTANAPSNVRWTVLNGDGLTHVETPFTMIPAGIRWTQDKSVWEMPRALADSVIDARGNTDALLNAWYKSLSARMGAEFAPSDKWLRTVLEAHVVRREYDEAIVAAKRVIADYPDDLAAYSMLADSYIALNDRDAAKRTLSDGLRILERMDLFDNTERDARRQLMKSTLDRIQRLP
jgi:enterochelin esterase-like enzyme